MDIRAEMPLLARHEGEWEGVYIHVDADGRELDRHASHLSCRFEQADGGEVYHQVNRYRWDDGREEVHDFPAQYRDRRLWFDTERIRGDAWEADEHTVILRWVYKDDERSAFNLYEMIQLSPDGNDRARTWHWFSGGEIIRRTLIKERRIDA